MKYFFLFLLLGLTLQNHNLYSQTNDNLEEMVAEMSKKVLQPYSRLGIYCRELTEKSRRATGYKQSYFYESDKCLIQVMYINEMVGGYGQKYRTMLKESKEPGYMDSLLSGMVSKYKAEGALDDLENQGFSHFRVELADENGNVTYSTKYPLY